MSGDSRQYYADLGVSPTASIDEIKAVYRALAKIYHPDVNKDRAAAEKFRRITEAYEIVGDPDKRAAYDHSASTSKQSDAEVPRQSQRHPVDPIECAKCKKVTAQPRFLVFRHVVSFVVMTWTTPKPGIFCSACASKEAFKASAISAAFGWWGLPWGPILTVREIFRNAFGGERHVDIDEQLIWQNAIAFMDGERYDLAGSLASQLVAARDSKIAHAAKHLVKILTDNGQKVTNLKSPWRLNFRSTVAQILMAFVIPAIGYVALANPFEKNYVRSYAPSRLPTQQDLKPIAAAPVAAINLCAQRPTNGQVLKSNIFPSKNGHRLTINNGSSGDAIIKLRSVPSGRLAVSFFVKRNMTASFDGFSDGSYTVQFAYGEAMTRDCKLFIDPVASQFDSVQRFDTEVTATQMITQELSFTLYNVPGGNVRPNSISAAEFNAN